MRMPYSKIYIATPITYTLPTHEGRNVYMTDAKSRNSGTWNNSEILTAKTAVSLSPPHAKSPNASAMRTIFICLKY